MKIKKFLLHSENIAKDSFIWNMFGSMLMAFQSVLMLMILTRILGLEEAGIFTIAYANANLFLTIGKYGMRNFQASDIKEEFTFGEYRKSRILTTVAMMVVSVLYVIYTGNKNGYTSEKSMIIIWMCLFKAVDVVEDVYHGLYQQKGRLDIAGKAMALRLMITIAIFAVLLAVSKNLLLTLVVSTIITAILMILFIRWSYLPFKKTEQEDRCTNIKYLLRICFPLFLGSFFSFYIGNAPKYAIDSILNDELQACYGFIAMPVFVIGLLNNFIFSPMIHRLSIVWIEGRMRQFYKIIFEQILVIAGITVICMGGAYMIGVPVLSVLYNTNLAPYKAELLILLLGGGFLALSGLLVTIITIIRFQKTLVFGYTFVAVLAYFLSPVLVRKYSMMGAAVLYLLLMMLLCMIFFVLMYWGINRKKSSRRDYD